MTTTATITRTGELLLARLLTAGKKPPGPTKLRGDLSRLLPRELETAAWQSLVDELASAGLVSTRPVRLTDAGRTRALEFLGIESLPPRTSWPTAVSRYLVPKVLGTASKPSGAKEREDCDKFSAVLLKRAYDLPAGAGASLKVATEALVCRETGFEGESTFEGVKQRILSRLLGVTEPVESERLQQQIVLKATGAKRYDLKSLREAAVRKWAEPSEDNGTGGAGAEGPFDLPAFAATVRAAARDCPTGRFGDNKVFISHVWRRLQGEPNFPQMGLAEFKASLVEANRQRLLDLSRADLVQFMSPEDVRESETPYLTTVFHFVLVNKEQP